MVVRSVLRLIIHSAPLVLPRLLELSGKLHLGWFREYTSVCGCHSSAGISHTPSRVWRLRPAPRFEQFTVEGTAWCHTDEHRQPTSQLSHCHCLHSPPPFPAATVNNVYLPSRTSKQCTSWVQLCHPRLPHYGHALTFPISLSANYLSDSR